MLRREELASWTATFRVADEQVRRDHLISHVLAALARLDDGGVVFYGGTALARTHLTRYRLSEDIDLLVWPRREWASRIETELPRALRRQFGAVRWDPGPTLLAEPGSARLVAGPLSLRVQLITLDAERRRWPTERRDLEMRYSDCPRVQLHVPTLAAFSAMKTVSWAERHAPRDLADLAGLAGLAAFDSAGAALVHDMTGWRPASWVFAEIPDETRRTWDTELGHQMAQPPDPDDCLAAVRSAWSAVADPPGR
jgi:hypothetical protein